MSLVTLARQVLEQAQALEAGMNETGIPPCSFAAGSPPDVPPQFAQSQQALLATVEELSALVAGPLQYLIRSLSPVHCVLLASQAITRFRLADHLKRDELVSYRELSQRCAVPEQDLQRVLRLAIAHRMFDEPEAGYVRHNATSLLFAEVPDLASWAAFYTEDMFPSILKGADAISKWPGSQELNQTAFSLAEGGQLTFFDALKSSAERRARFDGCMRFMLNAAELHPSFLLNKLEWNGDACPSSVVDMGGSYGHIAKALLERFPIKQCIVQDLPEVVETSQIPEHLEGRLQFQAHDLFMVQPVQADIYFLRSVLHDFPDEFAARILANIAPAMRPGAKIILNESCMVESGKHPKYMEQITRGLDLHMKCQFNSREREASDWREIVDAAQSGLVVDTVKIIPGSALALIEIVKVHN